MHLDGSGIIFEKVSLKNLANIAKELVHYAGGEKIWLFDAPMGAGKTTLIKAIGHELGIEDMMSSPTFSIVNEYALGPERKFFHFDFYRIKNEAEAYDIGAEEYFYSDEYCFIEWPEKIPSLIPHRHATVKIEIEDDTHRTIVVSIHD
jgi:tRNA threonylcarbamoyladenosine biosynthesis protein TsaE